MPVTVAGLMAKGTEVHSLGGPSELSAAPQVTSEPNLLAAASWMMGVSEAKDSGPKSTGAASASSSHISFHVAKEAPASTRHAGSMLRVQDHQMRSDGVRPALSSLFSAATTRT